MTFNSLTLPLHLPLFVYSKVKSLVKKKNYVFVLFRSNIRTKKKQHTFFNSINQFNTYLTGDLPVVKRGITWHIHVVTGRGMDINRQILLVAFKKLLPEGKHRQRPSGQKHERHLRNPVVRIILLLRRNHRRSPEQLVVAHPVAQILRPYEPSDAPAISILSFRRRLLLIVLVAVAVAVDDCAVGVIGNGL